VSADVDWGEIGEVYEDGEHSVRLVQNLPSLVIVSDLYFFGGKPDSSALSTHSFVG
jgi:hypothetical protein